MRIIREGNLKIFSDKEIKSKAFAQKMVRAKKETFRDLFFSTGFISDRSRDDVLNDTGYVLKDTGVYKLRGTVKNFIFKNLDMGDNIATQSVEKLKTPEDWLEVANNIASLIGYKHIDSVQSFTLKSVEDAWRAGNGR